MNLTKGQLDIIKTIGDFKWPKFARFAVLTHNNTGEVLFYDDVPHGYDSILAKQQYETYLKQITPEPQPSLTDLYRLRSQTKEKAEKLYREYQDVNRELQELTVEIINLNNQHGFEVKVKSDKHSVTQSAYSIETCYVPPSINFKL